MRSKSIPAALAAAVTLTVCSAANADITAESADTPTLGQVSSQSASRGNAKARKRLERKNNTNSKSDKNNTESLFLTEYEGDDCVSESFYGTAEAEGDVISIRIGKNYLNCTVKYGNVALMEAESTSKVLYFQGISEGKDNIVISETSENGVVLTEYIVTVDKDLTVDVYAEDMPLFVCND